MVCVALAHFFHLHLVMQPIDRTLVNKVKDLLLKKKESIAVAESVTAGLLQVALASADDAIRFFQGGVTTYNLGQKTRHLLVEPIHAVSCNCVSAQVAEEMALNVCSLFSSDWGVGVTGYASAVPESGNKLFCYYAIAHKSKIVAAHKIQATEKNAFDVQRHYVERIITELLARLKK